MVFPFIAGVDVIVVSFNQVSGSALEGDSRGEQEKVPPVSRGA